LAATICPITDIWVWTANLFECVIALAIWILIRCTVALTTTGYDGQGQNGQQENIHGIAEHLAKGAKCYINIERSSIITRNREVGGFVAFSWTRSAVHQFQGIPDFISWTA
jgi:hypothetical protein